MYQHHPYSGRFLRVRVDETDKGPYEIVERPPAVGIVALTTSDEVMLVRQHRPAAGLETLELPAGIIEEGESVADAAKRELLEETGYETGSIGPITTLLASPGYSDERIELVFATDCRPTGAPITDHRIVAVSFFALADIPAVLRTEHSTPIDGKTFAGLSWLLLHRQSTSET